MTKIPTKIGIIGAGGRMGMEIARAVHGNSAATIAAGLDQTTSPAFGKDIGQLIGVGPLDVSVSDDLDIVVQSSDIIIDLSLPTATESILEAAVAHQTPLVCGTTGVPESTLQKFNAAAAKIPVLYARNLSLGVTILTTLVQQASKALKEGFDIEIVEMHHRNKVDAPSGTALLLAEAAAAGRGLDPSKTIRNGREGHTGIRPEDEIGMHALRGGGVFGDHTVILASANERVELTHKAASRGLFAEGAVKAALFLVNQKPGRYEMTDVLKGAL